MHRKLLAKTVEGRRVRFALESDENADAAHTGGCSIVYIGYNTTVAHRNGAGATNDLVFTDCGDIVGQHFLNRTAIGIGRSQNRFGVIGFKAKRNFGNLADEILELFVLCNKVGLAVDFNSGTFCAGNSNGNEAFCSGAARLFCSGGEALGTQQIDGCFHVPIGFFQRLFGVHHAGARTLAQFLHG